MFIRCKHYSSTKKVVTICESRREGKKVIQKVVKYLGIAHDEKQLLTLKALAKSEIARLYKERAKAVPINMPKITPTPIENLIEHERFIEGFHDIFSPVFDQLELQDFFSSIRLKQLKDLIIARISEPCSKLHTAEILKKDFARSLTEDQIYKLMDCVEKQEEEIKLKIFEATKRYCANQVVDVLFFDVTTLYFESQQNDELRNFGYSKDHKVGEVQVVLALATTPEGLPIGYSLFPGNTAEVKTLLQCLEEWKKTIKIENVIVVADRAMMSDLNLQEMDKAQFKYVIAAKLRALPKSLKNEILNRQNEIEDKINEEVIRIQEHAHNSRRLVVSFSENRAKKDKGDRDRLVAKLKNKLNPDGTSKTRKLVTNNGYLKFTEEDKEGQVVFNESKIEEEAKWDGLHGIITNDKEAKAADLLQRYRGLWVIEESFRINKHSLEMRPIYHFKPERIKAHILICYIAFAMSRYVQQKVQMLDQRISIERIREELSRVESSILEDKGTKELYKMPSKISRDASAIYRAMGVTRQESPVKWKKM
jgi:transposase